MAEQLTTNRKRQQRKVVLLKTPFYARFRSVANRQIGTVRISGQRGEGSVGKASHR